MKKTHWEKAYTAWVVLFLVSLIPHLWVRSSNWAGSSDFHTCIEIVGGLICIVTGLLMIMRFYAMADRLFLLVGLGFMVNGGENLVHGVLSFERLFAGTGVDLTHFVPGTYVAGRCLLASFFILAAFIPRKTGKDGEAKRETIFFASLTVIVGAGVTALAFILPLPQFIYPARFISRPVDLFSSILFGIVAILFTRKYIRSKEEILWWITASCILIGVGQLFMSQSKQLYDARFDVAHWFSTLGYLAPLLGIGMQLLRLYRESEDHKVEAERHAEVLRAHNEQLQQMVEAKNRAEKLEDQKRQAEESRTAALNLMNEAKEHRKRAEKAAADLQDSQNRLSTIIENSPIGIMLINERKKIIEANPAAANIIGTLSRNITGKDCTEYFCPFEPEEEVCPILNSNAKTVFREVELTSATGEHLIVEKVAVPLSIRGERAVLEMFTDITKRKYAEKEIKEAREKAEAASRTLAVRVQELKQFNQMAIGREKRMIELKQRINKLCERCGEKPPYDLSFAETESANAHA